MVRGTRAPGEQARTLASIARRSAARGNKVALAAGAVVALISALPRGAAAFTVETVATRGCHEEITGDAWRAVIAGRPELVEPPSRGDDETVIADAPFTVPGDLNDIGAVALLFGVRDNDVKGMPATAFDEMAGINSDPRRQPLHCLRSAAQDEPDGSRAALADCHAYVRDMLLSALDGVDEQGLPDAQRREALEVTLALSGQRTIDLPLFHLRAGRALHAIEDGFTHTFRSRQDPHRITVVLNWVEFAENELDEARDGPAHLRELDRCDDPDDLRRERRLLAVEAAAAALGILLDDSLDRAGKGAEVDAMLQRYLAYDEAANCTDDNDWCDAAELDYAPSACGCRAVGSRSAFGALAPLALLQLLLVARWRRRARNGAALGALGATLLGGRAGYAAESEGTEEAPHGVDSPALALKGKSEAGKPGREDPAGSFFGRVALGAAYDKPGFSGGLGLRYQISRPLMLGFDSEWNPFVALSPTRLRAGTINSYVSLIRRFQMKYESVNIRTSAAAGVSVLLFDLVGAPAGSVGPFLGLSLLGLEWKATPGFYLTIDPTYIAFPIPHLTGVPFGYLQYRFLVGVEFGG